MLYILDAAWHDCQHIFFYNSIKDDSVIMHCSVLPIKFPCACNVQKTDLMVTQCCILGPLLFLVYVIDLFL